LYRQYTPELRLLITQVEVMVMSIGAGLFCKLNRLHMPLYMISSVSESSIILLLSVSFFGPFVGICIWYATSLHQVASVPAAGPRSVLSSSFIIGSVPVVSKPSTSVVITVPLGGENGYRPFLQTLVGSSVWISLVPVSWTVMK